MVNRLRRRFRSHGTAFRTLRTVPAIPDISRYQVNKTIIDIDLDGVTIPGLTGEFFWRQEGGRTATVGRYSYDGVKLFMSWGYRGEAHCAWTSYFAGDQWTVPHRGCPRIVRRPGAVLVGNRWLSTDQRPTRCGGWLTGSGVDGAWAGHPLDSAPSWGSEGFMPDRTLSGASGEVEAPRPRPPARAAGRPTADSLPGDRVPRLGAGLTAYINDGAGGHTETGD